MSQQINLLNPALIKQKDLLNPTNIAITLGLLVIIMLAYYNYAQRQLLTLTAQRHQVAGELSAVQEQLKQTALLHAPREQNKALFNEISLLEQKENMQQQVLQTVYLSSATPDKGYAALMRAFAKQSLDNLWLTTFSINSSADQLNISGRTLQADLVPEFISRLGNEPALKGKLFSALNMNLPKVDNSKNDASKTDNLAAKQLLSTSKSLSTQTALPVTAPVEKQYIEFTLQSINDKSESEPLTSTTAKAGDKP